MRAFIPLPPTRSPIEPRKKPYLKFHDTGLLQGISTQMGYNSYKEL